MSSEEKEPTPQFTKGYNSGYYIAQYDPELFNQILDSLKSESEYITGLKLGKKQYDRELLLEQLKQSQQRNKSKDMDMN